MELGKAREGGWGWKCKALHWNPHQSEATSDAYAFERFELCVVCDSCRVRYLLCRGCRVRGTSVLFIVFVFSGTLLCPVIQCRFLLFYQSFGDHFLNLFAPRFYLAEISSDEQICFIYYYFCCSSLYITKKERGTMQSVCIC